MASGDSAVKIVDSKDLADDSPMVRVESVEKASYFSYLLGGKKEPEEEVEKEDSTKAPSPDKEQKSSAHAHHESSHSHEVVHEGDQIKTTYDVEEDVPPSYLEQLKRKVHWNGR